MGQLLPEGFVNYPIAGAGAGPDGFDDDVDELKKQVNTLESSVKFLQNKLAGAEKRLWFLEQRTMASCQFANGTHRPDNETWKEECRTCACHNGVPLCSEEVCEEMCVSSMRKEGSCCPECRAPCIFMGVKYSHGEEISSVGPRGCARCRCENGHNVCALKKEICPVVTCPEAEQMFVDDGCCKQCVSHDYCGVGPNKCHEKAVCFNRTLGSVCQCQKGYAGNGSYCQDIDECEERGDPNGNHCRANTMCVNKEGSYQCNCLPGYERTNRTNRSCRDIDECQRKSHRCDGNAQCSNTDGSYTCQCLPGYAGDGFTCTPICEPACENGGNCFAPNTCACKGGFFGPECQVDLDECAFNISRCSPHSTCINIPGSYFCKCNDGFRAVNPYVKEPLCQDIDECSSGAHSCPSWTRCENLEGSWKCLCNGSENCDLTCSAGRSPHPFIASLYEDRCQNCTCQDAVLRCEPVTCDCNDDLAEVDVMEKCCPACNSKMESSLTCFDSMSNSSYPSGMSWFQNCRSCQCMLGKIRCSPVECPAIACAISDAILPLESHNCCPVCPASNLTTIDDICLDIQSNMSRLSTAIKFSCGKERFQQNMAAFFTDWTVGSDICHICHCENGSICCTVQNQCPLKSKSKPAAISSIKRFSTKRPRVPRSASIFTAVSSVPTNFFSPFHHALSV